MRDELDRAILASCARGLTLAEVSREVGVGRSAVARRLQRLRAEWEVPTTLAAVVLAVRRGDI